MREAYAPVEPYETGMVEDAGRLGGTATRDPVLRALDRFAAPA